MLQYRRVHTRHTDSTVQATDLRMFHIRRPAPLAPAPPPHSGSDALLSDGSPWRQEVSPCLAPSRRLPSEAHAHLWPTRVAAKDDGGRERTRSGRGRGGRGRGGRGRRGQDGGRPVGISGPRSYKALLRLSEGCRKARCSQSLLRCGGGAVASDPGAGSGGGGGAGTDGGRDGSLEG